MTNKMMISTTFCTILPVNKFCAIIFSLNFEIRAAKIEMFLNKRRGAYLRSYGT